jgi:pyridoxal phosphate enzyme (YggS family)
MSQHGSEVVERNLSRVRERMEAACRRAGRAPEDVRLVAVTKSAPIQAVRDLYALGLRDFGESRPQAIWERRPLLPSDVRWHLIGNWQTNKVRRTIPLIEAAHSIDRRPLAEAVSAEALRCGRRLPVMLEVKLASDERKHGFSPEDLREQYPLLLNLKGIDIVGLMTMAPWTSDVEVCRGVFRRLRLLRDELRDRVSEGPKLESLSMGMSNDFETAIEEGATHVRVGGLLFEGLEAAQA